MKPISNIPLGLLELFGLKQQGRYPTEASDSIAFTYDVKDLLEVNGTASQTTHFRYPVAGALGSGMIAIEIPNVTDVFGIVQDKLCFLITHAALTVTVGDAAGGTFAPACIAYNPSHVTDAAAYVPLSNSEAMQYGFASGFAPFPTFIDASDFPLSVWRGTEVIRSGDRIGFYVMTPQNPGAATVTYNAIIRGVRLTV